MKNSIGGASDYQAMATLNNLVRVGYVSDVDLEKRNARVIFNDKLDENGKPLVSAWLRVLDNRPLITHEKWVEEIGEENKYEFEAEYHSHPRDLGLGEEYIKTASKPDIFKNRKIVKYEKRETISEGNPIQNTCGCQGPECPLHGVIEHKLHHQKTTVYPWLPYVGQFVLCIYLPNGEHDGFILGGIDA